MTKFERRQSILDTELGIKANCKGPQGSEMPRAPWSSIKKPLWANKQTALANVGFKHCFLITHSFQTDNLSKEIIPPPILSQSLSPCYLLPQLHGQECSSNRGWHLQSSSDPSLWPVTGDNDIHHLANIYIKTTVEPPLHECSFFARYRRRGGPSQPRWRTRPLGLACGNTNLWNDLTY